MQQRLHNIFSRRQPWVNFPNALLLFVLLLATPNRATADIGWLMKHSGFKNVVIAVIALNKSMESAAQNPMDKWRRQNVQHAFSLLPAAVATLAQEFADNKLHDPDFSIVQQTLGGFVDVAAPDRIAKFIENPSRNLIPRVGPEFPSEASVGSAGDSERLSVRNDGTKMGVSTQGSQASFAESIASNENLSAPKTSQLINLSNAASKNGRLSLDENAVKNVGPASEEEGVSSPSKKQENLQGVANDLSAAEAEVNEKTDDKSQEDFFRADKKDKKKPVIGRGNRKGLRSSVTAETYQLTVKPKYWRVLPLLHLTASLEIPLAIAADPAPAVAPVDTSASSKGTGGCQSCQGSGDSGGKGGGKGSGQDSSKILFAMAAMMAAAAPMIGAAMQSSADIKMARISAQTQEDLARINQNTSMNLAASQERMSDRNAQVAEQDSDRKTQLQRQLATAQLNEISAARKDNNAIQQQQAAQLAQRENQRLAIDVYNTQQQLELDRQQKLLQLAQSGNLGNATTLGTSAANSLTVNRVMGPLTNNALGQAYTSPLPGSSLLAPAASGPVMSSLGGLNVGRAVVSASNRLLAAVSNPSSVSPNSTSAISTARTQTGMGSSPLITQRGFIGGAAPRNLKAYMALKGSIRGSRAGQIYNKEYLASLKASGGDITSFTKSVQGISSSFASSNARHVESTSPARGIQKPTLSNSTALSNSYNAPALSTTPVLLGHGSANAFPY